MKTVLAEGRATGRIEADSFEGAVRASTCVVDGICGIEDLA